MRHDRQYFISEIEKIRVLAVNRGWQPTNQEGAAFVFSADLDPREVNVEHWADTFQHIEQRHGIPMTICGGGYGCFTISTTSAIETADRFVTAAETDMELQGYLNRAAAKLVEVWKWFDGKSSVEIVAPRYGYKTILATNRLAPASIHKGARTALDVFARDDDGELTAGILNVWVYDPRASANRPGIAKRLWRKLFGGPRGAQEMDISWSDLEVADLPSLVDDIAPHFQEIGTRSRFGILVHGYATSLPNAVKQFGNFIHTVRYDQINTVPVLFAWPSLGRTIAYPADVPLAERSEQKFAQLLAGLATREKPAPAIYVVAHSHGTKLTFGGTMMNARALPGRQAGSIENLVFVAPDIDAKLFDQHLADLSDRAKAITVYYSQSDIALTISTLQSRRLGQRPKTPAQVDAVDIIDASFLNTEWKGHGYHIGCPEMHDDIRGLLEGQPASRRQLLARDDKSQVWRLLPIR